MIFGSIGTMAVRGCSQRRCVAVAVLAAASRVAAGCSAQRSFIALTLAFNEVQNLGHGVTLYFTVGKAFDDRAFWWMFGPIYELAFRAGLAVLSGWVTLALTGRWQSAVGWLDRSGRFVGWAWVALGLVAWVIECQTLFVPPNVIPPGIPMG